MMNILTMPVLIFGSLIAFLVGALTHLIGGGKFLRLVFSMVFSWIGFWAGNSISDKLNIHILQFGQVNYLISIAGSILLAIFGFWISGDTNKGKTDVEQ